MANETVQGLKAQIIITGQVNGINGARQVILVNEEVSFTDGNGINQVEQVFYDDARALNATNEDIDVSGSTQTDFQGGALALSKIRLAFFKNRDSDTGDTLTVKQPASNGVPNLFIAAGDGVKIPPGGMLLYIAPAVDAPTVTASTADLINVAKADNGTYDILLAG